MRKLVRRIWAWFRTGLIKLVRAVPARADGASPPDGPPDRAGAEVVSEHLYQAWVDQCERWRRGERALAEAYLEQFPDLRADEHAAVDLIYGELLLREELGERPDASEYLRRFPQYATELQRQLALHQIMRGGSTEPRSGVNTEWLGPAPEAVTAPLYPRPPEEVNGQAGARPGADGAPWPAVPDYRVTGVLGRGAMGIVYRAEQLSLPRTVALKVVRDGGLAEPQELARLRKEAEAACRLSHPNIVKVYCYGEHAGQP